MKITPLLFGALNAQSGDDSERWDATDFNFNSDVFNYADNSSAKWSTTTKAVAAVTCWESNMMGDLAHYDTQADDNQGWGNVHHGHDQNAHAGSPTYQVGSFAANMGANAHAPATGETTLNKMDMHSAMAYDNRLSGCIYEAAAWNYDADTYDLTFKVEYGADATATFAVSGKDLSGGANDAIRPVWWHYFNAHTIPGITGTGTGTGTGLAYGSTMRHLICMANPSYEGLGYLNFIVTYGRFIDGTNNDLFAHGHNQDNVNTRGLSTPNYSGGYAFTITQGADNADTNDQVGQWYSTYGGSTTWSKQMGAVSSFPHNDLGKDFRFNVRILHKGGLGDPSQATTCTDCKDSYYWYKVDEIELAFPHVVRCPKEASNIAGDSTPTFRCMDSANHNGHRGWPVRTANDHSSVNPNDVNKVAYIETLDVGGSAYAGTLVGATAKDTDTGYICGDTAMADGEWYQCGKNYKVIGLMNTYDEFAQQEFGTMQEFWFQFHYHFVLAYNGDHRDAETLADPNQTPALVATTIVDVSAAPGYGNGDTATTNSAYDHRHNFPNTLFNSFEITSVAFNCNAATRDTRLNTNAC
jgi:hypothetical protein